MRTVPHPRSAATDTSIPSSSVSQGDISSINATSRFSSSAILLKSLIGNVSVSDAEKFIASRKAAGINTLWINLLCVQYTGCRSDGTTFDGIAPFTTPQDLSTPNEAYFARADAMISLAEKYGILVFLDPIETGGWLQVLRDNGVSKDYAYGRYVGERYRRFPNVIWFSGNDFQDWRDPALDAGVLAVARGIRSTEPSRLQTVELNFDSSGSLDDRRWRNLIDLDAAYTYSPTYAQVLNDYNRSNIPVFMVEAVYEFENIGTHEPGTPLTLRRQAYWSFLSGTTGQLYGNGYTWRFRERVEVSSRHPRLGAIRLCGSTLRQTPLVPACSRSEPRCCHLGLWCVRGLWITSPPQRLPAEPWRSRTCRPRARSRSTWESSPAPREHSGSTRRMASIRTYPAHRSRTPGRDHSLRPPRTRRR